MHTMHILSLFTYFGKNNGTTNLTSCNNVFHSHMLKDEKNTAKFLSPHNNNLKRHVYGKIPFIN